MDAPISKPSLLCLAFELGVAYSAGIAFAEQNARLAARCRQYGDFGETYQLAGRKGLVGLQKFSIDTARSKASIPK